MQQDRRRSAALRRPVPAAAGGPSQSPGRFGAPRDVLVPGQGGVVYRDSRPPSEPEAPAPPPEGGGQGAQGGQGAPGGQGQQPQGGPQYGPGPYGAPPQGPPQNGPGPQDAPPQGQPPQGPQGSHGGGQGAPQHGGQGGQDGQGNGHGNGHGNGQNGGQDQPPPPWGSQWSSHQPPPGHGGWGGGDHGQQGPGGPQNQGPRPDGSSDGPGPGRDNGRGNGDGPGKNLRWDPTDPVQRRSRYALLAGMWGFFFALFNWWPLALLLGSLALYWGIDALRGKSRAPGNGAAANGRANGGGTDAYGQPVQRQARGGRPHTTAAITGIVAAGITLSIVLVGFSVQIAYRDYFNCRSDALTEASKEHCSDELPKPLRTFFERD
ncbi:hypothetical protein [Streptomyces sp. CNQ-509]|uniref:hypothetical protein n=1 Tax=Streptomyces sp. CNQ-509 TaxID=444103 RepID=UPI0026574651|nr:hypothetical protein [Streptomyces sp. CNQ-509]